MCSLVLIKSVHPLIFSSQGVWLCGHLLPSALDTENSTDYVVNLIILLSISLDLICHSHPQQSVMGDTCDLLWLPEVLPNEIVGIVNYNFLH